MTVGTVGTAVISDDDKYRYRLTRYWDNGVSPGFVTFVMLNPSTADATLDDPTIRRCKGYAFRWGYSGIHVVNLYGLRATDPWDLGKVDDPFGPENLRYVVEAMDRSVVTIVAWGAHRMAHAALTAMSPYGNAYRDIFAPLKVRCLAKNKDGSPKHPLYAKSDLEPDSWWMK